MAKNSDIIALIAEWRTKQRQATTWANDALAQAQHCNDYAQRMRYMHVHDVHMDKAEDAAKTVALYETLL